MTVYPVALVLEGRACLVIGGGAIAQRKVQGLLEAGAVVTVISPRLTHALHALAVAGRIRHVRRRYRGGDLAGFSLALAATGDAAVSAAVSREGRARGVWVNAADDPTHCDFLLPSLLRRGDLSVAVSTGGRSPALARAVRERLEDVITEDYAALTEVAADVRLRLRERGRPADAEAWRRALRGGGRPLLAAGRRADARRRLLARLEAS